MYTTNKAIPIDKYLNLGYFFNNKGRTENTTAAWPLGKLKLEYCIKDSIGLVLLNISFSNNMMKDVLIALDANVVIKFDLFLHISNIINN